MSEAKETPLTAAIMLGNVKGIRLLHEYGADMNQPINGVMTPVNVAVKLKAYDMVRVLVELGGWPDKGTMFRCAPLDIAKSVDDEGK